MWRIGFLLTFNSNVVDAFQDDSLRLNNRITNARMKRVEKIIHFFLLLLLLFERERERKKTTSLTDIEVFLFFFFSLFFHVFHVFHVDLISIEANAVNDVVFDTRDWPRWLRHDGLPSKSLVSP